MKQFYFLLTLVFVLSLTSLNVEAQDSSDKLPVSSEIIQQVMSLDVPSIPFPGRTAILTGIYKEGIVLDTSNYVQISLDIPGPGQFTITSDLVNGIKFSSTAVLNGTGKQLVTLKASGTPIAKGVFPFHIRFGDRINIINITVLSK